MLHYSMLQEGFVYRRDKFVLNRYSHSSNSSSRV